MSVDLTARLTNLRRSTVGLNAILKFNPNQTRADDGRWTDGGAVSRAPLSLKDRAGVAFGPGVYDRRAVIKAAAAGKFHLRGMAANAIKTLLVGAGVFALAGGTGAAVVGGTAAAGAVAGAAVGLTLGATHAAAAVVAATFVVLGSRGYKAVKKILERDAATVTKSATTSNRTLVRQAAALSSSEISQFLDRLFQELSDEDGKRVAHALGLT